MRIKTPLAKMITAAHWDDWLKEKTLAFLAQDEIENIPLTNHFRHGNNSDIEDIDARQLAIWHEAIWCGITGLLTGEQANLSVLIETLNRDTTQIIPFMGQDTEFYYTIALSSVLYGLGIPYVYPRISVQKFVKLDGKKFSSSRNHLIYLQELLQQYPIDIIRLYCLSVLKPYQNDSNDFIVSDLHHLHQYFNKFKTYLVKISTKKPTTQIIFNNTLLRHYNQAMIEMSFSKVYKLVMECIELINQSPNKESSWANIASFLVMVEPIMPEIASELKQLLNINNSQLDLMSNKLANSHI